MRAIEKHLRFAWLEYEDSRDGAVFTHASTSRLGFENALSDLPRAKGSRTSRSTSNLFYTKIRLKTYGKHRKRPFRGLLAIPGDGDESTLERWVTSPAIEGDKFVSEPNAGAPIDLLVVSGHGSSGDVWGDASGERAQINLPNAFGMYIDEERSGRLKCLIVPTCNNLHEALAGSWLPLFNHEKPVYVVLGYEGSYTGGPYGAQVMANFVRELSATPTLPLIRAWQNANEAVAEKQPWGALAAKGAEKMSLQGWLDDSLPTLTRAHKLLHFNSDHPNGRPPTADREYEVLWIMEDGTEINERNNHSANAKIGLFDGEKGKIRIRAMKPGRTLKRGQQVYLLIYLYRGSRQMELRDLLSFAPNLREPQQSTGEAVVTIEEEKAVFNDSLVDAVRITVPSDTDVLQLSFEVSKSATNTFKASGPRGTHGRFLLDFVYEYEFYESVNGDLWINPTSEAHRNVFAANTGALLRSREKPQ